MAGLCAQQTAGADVKLPLQIAALNASIGQGSGPTAKAQSPPEAGSWTVHEGHSDSRRWRLAPERICRAERLQNTTFELCDLNHSFRAITVLKFV